MDSSTGAASGRAAFSQQVPVGRCAGHAPDLCRVARAGLSPVPVVPWGLDEGSIKGSSKHMSQLILKTGLCVAAMNETKKCYFDLVTYWHEGLFLLHCGKPELLVCAHWGPWSPTAPWTCGQMGAAACTDPRLLFLVG